MSGIYNLGDATISAAVTNSVITEGVSSAQVAQEFIDGLDWMAAVTLFVNFTWGASGTTAILKIQTTLDSLNWVDIARFDFATASLSKIANLSGLTPVNVATLAVLATEGRLDGVLGDRLRAVLTTTGVYSGNTSISVRASVR